MCTTQCIFETGLNISAKYSFIGLNVAGFNLQCLSNSKRLFSETLSPKNNGQVSFDKKLSRCGPRFVYCNTA